MRLTVLWLLLGVAPGLCGQTASPEVAPSASPELLEQVLTWLPASTETVFTWHEPFMLSHSQARNSRDARMRFQLMACSAFSVGDCLPSLLEGHRVLVAATGTRNFRAPASLGSMVSDGCSVLILSDPVSWETALTAAANHTYEIDGHTVWEFEEMREDDLWKAHVTFPRSGVLLASYDQPSLLESLRRMESSPTDRALNESLALWGEVDTSAAFWAVRQYSPLTAATDPTNPGNPHCFFDDPMATAVTFSFDAISQSGTLRMLTPNPNARAIMQRHLDSLGLVGTVEMGVPRAGVAEVTGKLDTPQVQMGLVFLLLGYLGHAIYL